MPALVAVLEIIRVIGHQPSALSQFGDVPKWRGTLPTLRSVHSMPVDLGSAVLMARRLAESVKVPTYRAFRTRSFPRSRLRPCAQSIDLLKVRQAGEFSAPVSITSSMFADDYLDEKGHPPYTIAEA